AAGAIALLLGAIAAIGHAAAQGISVPAERTFRDWVVGCDNARGCIAVGMIPATAIEPALVHVQRDAGRAAAPRITFVLYDESPAPPAGPQMLIGIDDAPIEGVGSARPVAPVADFGGFVQAALADDEVAPFVDGLRRGRSLRVAIDGGASADVSLDGAMAALLFMDDVQGRVGTSTALARPPRQRASSVPEPPPLPLVRPQPAPAGLDVEPGRAMQLSDGWVKETAIACAQDPSSPSLQAETMAPLGGDRVLVAVACGGGAYNFDFVFGIVQPGEPLRVEPARFGLPAVDGSAAASVGEGLTNADIDAEAPTVGFISKGRGIGDCGSSGTYAWTGEEFVLADWRVMPECRGVPEPYWPVLWRSRDR
ncbi:MAG TPA: DUF1176 domain-containing protein, partial [Rhodospirillales bacterium]|nr:DUF1176 domain-containing protein [Rhodospirillales bacterium]